MKDYRITSEPPKARSLKRLVSWLAENVAFISWHKHWKCIYLHCIHPRYCVRLYLWGCDRHLKAKYVMGKPANDRTERQPPGTAAACNETPE